MGTGTYSRPLTSVVDRQAELLVTLTEAMERDLGAWLRQRAQHVVTRANPQARRGCVTSLWRGLVAVWCTSPDARRRYPFEAREGLLAALESMDDATALSLVRGIMKEAKDDDRPTASAAA